MVHPRRILIPVDFKVESLITLKKAIDGIGEQRVAVTLLYAEHLSDSIIELLFYSPEDRKRKLVPPVFREALTILRNRYERNLAILTIDLFHGYGVNALRNFLEARGIDQVYLPTGYVLRPTGNGFNPVAMLRKSGVPVQEVRWETDDTPSDPQQLSRLFH